MICVWQSVLSKRKEFKLSNFRKSRSALVVWRACLLLSCCVLVFVLCHFCAVCLQGLPGLPSLAALHSNQILTVKVCWHGRSAQADSVDGTHTDIHQQNIRPLCPRNDRLGPDVIVSDKFNPTNQKIPCAHYNPKRPARPVPGVSLCSIW